VTKNVAASAMMSLVGPFPKPRPHTGSESAK
jgi:hypothetical protein